jgi:hypothetical protein
VTGFSLAAPPGRLVFEINVKQADSKRTWDLRLPSVAQTASS